MDAGRRKDTSIDSTECFRVSFPVLCGHIDESSAGFIADEALTELEVNRTMEAGRFISDVMETMNSRKDIENIDYITGLPTRNVGEIKIAQSMQESAGCLLFLDMDNLKKINDIYGHRSGDKALRHLGNTINECAQNATACRIGGDEFLLFLPNFTREAACEMVRQIYDSFYEKKETSAEAREASLSGGVCMSRKGDDFTECYAKADVWKLLSAVISETWMYVPVIALCSIW